MVWVRIITAAVLILAFVPALFLLPEILWNALCIVVVAACAWEWAALSGMRRAGCLFFAVVIAASAAGFLISSSGREWCFVVGTLFWTLGAPALLWARPLKATSLIKLAIGVIVLVPACLSLFDLRRESPGLLLAVLAIAWVSDSSRQLVLEKRGKGSMADLSESRLMRWQPSPCSNA